MTEFIRKLYIDSRYRTHESASSSDFEIDLPQTVNVSKNALGWISDLHLPVTWYNVDQHNNRLYLSLKGIVNGAIEHKVQSIEVTPGNYTGDTLAAELLTKLNARTLILNVAFFVYYLSAQGCIQIAYGINALFEGYWLRPGSLSIAKLTRTGGGYFSVTDSTGAPLADHTFGATCRQEGTALIFESGEVATFDGNALNFESGGAWTPYENVANPSDPFTHPGVVPSGNIPSDVSALVVPEVFLRSSNSAVFRNFTESGFINDNQAVSIDPNNIRSINEDVLKISTNTAFNQTGSSRPAAKSSVLNLLGHGSPIYITSPDVSALSSLGPQGESSILAKVTGVEDFGKVIVHSPFAEMDYFRASNNIFKRIRFRLIFSSGAVVDMHNANWSFSIIFQQAE